MKTIFPLQAQSSCQVLHTPVSGLGLCHTGRKEHCYRTSRTQNAPHALPLSWESTVQTQHWWGRWAAAWCELNCSLVTAEGSDKQTPAVLALHSAYKCRNLSLVISSMQYFSLFLTKIAHNLHVHMCRCTERYIEYPLFKVLILMAFSYFFDDHILFD